MKTFFKNAISCLNYFINRISFRAESEKGQTLIEYGLLLVLIAVVVLAAVTLVGQKTNNLYNEIGTKLPVTP
jgi:pilus assembly protein Flp/PilA